VKCGFGAECKYGCPEHLKIEVEYDEIRKRDQDWDLGGTVNIIIWDMALGRN
jgi:hypothetical protein